jgi:hypothetical protein
MSSVSYLASVIHSDLEDLCAGMNKSPREKLAVMVGAVVETQSCNLMELAACLPLKTARMESRYAWIERFLSASTVDEVAVMQPLAAQLLEWISLSNQTVVLCLDQTCLGDTHGIAMLSVRVGNRGLPLFWKVENTAGNLPTAAYLELLKQAESCLPPEAKVLVMADRFFDAVQIIEQCQTYGWGWRLRLKQNRILHQEGGEISAGELFRADPLCQQKARLGAVETYVGGLHEAGHPEPWIIAMDVEPSKTRVLDYGLRWSIEAMFSDYKTRGFGLEDSQIKRPDRLSKLLLVLAVAMHWAVFCGTVRQKKKPKKAA